MWAILGEDPPHGWQPAEARDGRGMELAAAETPEPDAVRDGGGPGAVLGDVLHGAMSWFRGIGRAGGQVLDAMGATNAQDQAAARRANHIALEVLKEAATHPRETLEFIRQGVPPARDYVGEHPGAVGGRGPARPSGS